MLTKISKKEGRLISSQLTARSKIEVFKALIKRKMQGHKERSLAEHLATAAEQLNGQRNKFIHGTWAHPPGNEESYISYSLAGLPTIGYYQEDIH